MEEIKSETACCSLSSRSPEISILDPRSRNFSCPHDAFAGDGNNCGSCPFIVITEQNEKTKIN
jgi:hypothetical protein